MSARSVTTLIMAASAIAALFVAPRAGADEGLRFFDDDALSFEHPKGQAEPRQPQQRQPVQDPQFSAPPAAVRPASVRPPPPMQEQGQRLGTIRTAIPSAAMPAGGGVIVNGDPRPGAATPKPPPPPLPPEARPPSSQTTRPSGEEPGAVGLIGGDVHVEVLLVRALNKDERESTKGKLRCREPLTAEIRADPGTRTLLAQSAGIAASRLPERFGWIFGRDRACEDRPEGLLKRKLESIEAVMRRSAPPREGP